MPCAIKSEVSSYVALCAVIPSTTTVRLPTHEPKLTVVRTSSGLASSVITIGNPALYSRYATPDPRSPAPRIRISVSNSTEFLLQMFDYAIWRHRDGIDPDAGCIFYSGGNGRRNR